MVAARSRGVILASVTALALLCSPVAIAELQQVTVISASAGTDARSGRPILNIRLADESRLLFSAFTKSHVGYPIELRVDGQSIFKAVLREPITGGDFQVDTGTIDEARRLADKLSRGSVRVEFEAASQ